MPPKKAAKKTATKKPAAKKSAAKKTTTSDAKKRVKVYETVRGMKDIKPLDGHYWVRMFHAMQNICKAYGYSYAETPVLEAAQLFVKSIGKGTDVVDKEMYSFEDRDGNKVAMRPEFTAGFARSFVNHGLFSLPQPVRMWTQGPLFRYDRPQAGRYRQFHQFDCEVIGERDPVIDAELIAISYNFLRDLGISAEVYINSIGTPEDRQNYTIELVGYLRSKRSYLSEESRKRITKNPLRILDSKDEKDQEVIQEGPQIIDWLSQESKQFFMKVLEYLDELQIPYVLQPTLVRGLDYYTDTVFELYTESSDHGSQSALGGGGRYDGLVELLGGKEQTPASGFAIGLERVILALREIERNEKKQDSTEKKERSGIFFAQLGEQARRKSLRIIEDLRRNGIFVHSSISKGSLRAQLEIADKENCSHSVILGQKEAQDNTVVVRDMDSGIQEIIDQKKLESYLRSLIKNT
ncbi:MAG: histidine--tRNA ligase [Candidatus Magasanikbacteria bacterium]|nr:histidine--tRNA ligase [Candidatus Magasanikbacteria bacterium]|tara:strand:- start:2163 stop:3557 length:1395 start_codon:yes stop_codon:yes gene_type:complete